MRKVALLATLAIAVLALAFFLSRPSPSPLTLRPVKVSPLLDTDGVNIEFTVNNPQSLAFHAKTLENRANGQWVTVPANPGYPFHTSGTTNFVLTFTKAPHGRVRLLVETFRPTHGLATFWFRLQQRFVNHRPAPLNPFDSTLTIYRRQAEVVSEEFTVP